jgi:hypothetical protein
MEIGNALKSAAKAVKDSLVQQAETYLASHGGPPFGNLPPS